MASSRGVRKGDVLWLRLASIEDPVFGPGVPWNMAPKIFERLMERGYIKSAESFTGNVRAVATPKAAERIDEAREWVRKKTMKALAATAGAA